MTCAYTIRVKFIDVWNHHLGVPVQHHLHFVSINVVGSMSHGTGVESVLEQHACAEPSASVPLCSMARRGNVQFFLNSALHFSLRYR
jgi:hypothetical protein